MNDLFHDNTYTHMQESARALKHAHEVHANVFPHGHEFGQPDHPVFLQKSSVGNNRLQC